MRAALAQRQIVLAGVALLAAIGALALTSHGDHAKATGLLQPMTLNGSWRVSPAGAEPVQFGRRTDCSIILRPSTVGVTDSVLPCGVKLFVQYGNSPEILTQVIARRPVPPGRKFELTPKLAEKLGIDGVQPIRWVFAGEASR